MKQLYRCALVLILVVCGCAGEAVIDVDSGTISEGGSRAALCAQFCAGEMSVCTTDTACPHSCETAPNEPTQAAIDCADTAATCAETNPCWNMLGL